MRYGYVHVLKPEGFSLPVGYLVGLPEGVLCIISKWSTDLVIGSCGILEFLYVFIYLSL
jgi:hypothetical protein